MLYGAMTPGTEISMTTVATPDRCEKCHAKFIRWSGSNVRIDEKWCDSCNQDPTTDLMEDEFWHTTYRTPYVFAGWKFKVNEMPDVEHGVALMLHKKLPYPEDPAKILSAAWGHVSEKPRLAAWLIGHWYEHLLQICPCLHGERDQGVDEGDGSPFRQAVIDSLLWYHAEGLI